MEIKRSNRIKGFSIVEILITMTLFAVVATVISQSLTSSLKNSRKSEAVSKARENTEYAVGTMERLLRNAKSITSCTPSKLDYIDELGNGAYFSCEAGGFIASNSASVKLTSTDVVIDCAAITFECPPPVDGVPQAVLISVKAKDNIFGGGAEGSEITSKTKILLRTYTIY